MSITDETKFSEWLDQSDRDDETPMARWEIVRRHDIKMAYSLDKSVRQHAGTGVHRLRMKFDAAYLSPDQGCANRSPGNQRYGNCHGPGLLPLQPRSAELGQDDRQIVSSAVKPDVTLESIAAFGGGKQAYLDIDMMAI